MGKHGKLHNITLSHYVNSYFDTSDQRELWGIKFDVPGVHIK